MMTLDNDFPLDNLVCWSVMDYGAPSEFLTTLGALKITFSIIFSYHVDVALYESPGALLFITVE